MRTTSRARRSRSPCSAAPALPEELVVWEILIRLPAKALLRCRAVCRSWRRLTSGADFLARHQRQPSLPLFVSSGQIRTSGNVPGSTLDAFDLRAGPAAAERRPAILRFTDCSPYLEFKVYASCNGLLLLSIWNHRFYYICNPATCQWKALPSLLGAKVAALYPHSSSGEYRVLYTKQTKPDVDAAYYILTLGSVAEPRCVGLPAAAASASIKKYIAAGLLFGSERPPVLLHSCLHWILYSSQLEENALIVFDTVAESFRGMSPPSENRPFRHLLERNGTLGFSHIDESKMLVKLWVLQDYEREVWSFKYQIELPMLELRRSIDKNCSLKVQVVSEKGDVLVSCSCFCHLFHCDSMGKLLQKFRRRRVFSRPIGHWFKESLVRHAFLQGQDGDHVVLPPFFQGF